MRSKIRFVTLLGLLLALLVSGVVYATTIAVDGDPADWPAEAKLVTDPSDSGGGGGDISDVYFTNDSTNLYWRFDTYAASDWMELDTVLICMDTDNNQSNGSSDCCGGGFKTDYALEIMENSFQLRDATDGSGCGNAASSTGSAATADSTTEVRALLSELGITSNRTIPSQIETFGSGDVVSGLSPQVPGPTVVRLDGFTARSVETLWGFGGAAALLVLAASGLVLRCWVRRSQVLQ